MIQKRVKIKNKLGLHARPSALLVKAATKYRSDFHIRRGDTEVNGKSVMGVMILAAEYGAELDLVANGVDEEYLISEITELIESGFGE